MVWALESVVFQNGFTIFGPSFKGYIIFHVIFVRFSGKKHGVTLPNMFPSQVVWKFQVTFSRGWCVPASEVHDAAEL